MWHDFKAFIARGNVLDLAVGIIIGGAFGQVIATFVNDVVMPPIGLLVGRVNFASLYINLSARHYPSLAAADAAGAPVIAYGLFINALVNFMVVALVIFLALRGIQRARKPTPAPVASVKSCPFCYTAIPIQAVRCPACTSYLPAAPAKS
ncbi:large conductance mechanosensitive channel protein [Sulfobacillus acidophilus TPY]|uniref:Large-conductance mechanosensitive channel n=1 Tax=Sulfobacillus acidophilus (strain ATCC 700253 / DSM 10332 / NAL) TaxID=679936 RepID=G8TZC4_SULAD|nr:large conductance mechanosensitive channel protein [Sulfobacillus acidophilus TPY]AEW04093.1 Large-conductance mechanosensitive channel [Sulfobacillus acidophilus DSM 10332]